MADIVDMAATIEAETIAHGIARVVRHVDAGASGECEECEWWMPRLVAGRCAFCRDGRARPDDWEPPVPPTQIASPAPATPMLTERTDMAESKSITFVATGEVLAEIKRRTADGASNNRAALDLIEAAIAGQPSVAPPAQSRVPTVATIMADLHTVFDDLVDRADQRDCDLGDVIARADAAEAREKAAIERADVAESKLAQLRALVA